ncbi:MAG: hypothetical protein ACOC3G_07840 [Phycisphaeraceae bacterium]
MATRDIAAEIAEPTELTAVRPVATSTIRRACDALDQASGMMTALAAWFESQETRDHGELRAMAYELRTISDDLNGSRFRSGSGGAA